MTDALKKQLCYAGGTLLGWSVAKLTAAKETVPFTIIGGLFGFAAAEEFVESGKRKKESLAPAQKSLSGVTSRSKKRNKPRKK